MICDSGEISPVSIDFQEAGTLYPEELSFSTSDDNYDTLICKFGSETAQRLYDNRNEGLNEVQRATFRVHGEPVKAMYYKPDFLQLGENIEARDYYGVLELHDLHEHLKNGIVDYAPQEATVEDIYREIWRRVETSNNIITGLEINIEDSSTSVSEARGFNSNERGGALGISSPVGDDEILDVDFNWVINFDEQSPLKSIQEANKKMALTSHISPEGKLVIGDYNSNNSHTANKIRDGESHLIKSVGVTGYNSDVGKVILEGDTSTGIPGNTAESIENTIEYWNPFDDAGGRVRGKVIVETPTGGRTVTLEGHELTPRPEYMVPVAKRALVGILSKNPSGQIVLDYNNGIDTNIKVGDTIQLENPVTCGDLVNPSYSANEYIVSGVTHRYNSSWEVIIEVINDLGNILDNIDVTFEYWDISDQQGFEHSELYDYLNKEDGQFNGDFY